MEQSEHQKITLKGPVEIDFEEFIKHIDPPQAMAMIRAIDKSVADFDYLFDYKMEMAFFFLAKLIEEWEEDEDGETPFDTALADFVSKVRARLKNKDDARPITS